MVAKNRRLVDKSFDYIIIGGGYYIPWYIYSNVMLINVHRLRTDSCSATLRRSVYICCSPWSRFTQSWWSKDHNSCSATKTFTDLSICVAQNMFCHLIWSHQLNTSMTGKTNPPCVLDRACEPTVKAFTTNPQRIQTIKWVFEPRKGLVRSDFRLFDLLHELLPGAAPQWILWLD